MMYQLLDISASTIDWSRGQFALTAIYHWLFVPLTLGLALIMGIVETCYYRTRKRFWKDAAKFWQKLFGVNFAMGVATGIILEFEFGTNWSNYSWFVGDIFGAPLAIEGILAFFMESTFVAVMFFGWKKVSPGFHLASTWLTGIGATLSAWWILVANAWMQYPVGQTFNPDTMRFEMNSFFDVALSPFAVGKFCHTVTSSWIIGAVFVVGVCSWYLLKRREQLLAINSLKVATIVGLAASLLAAATGHDSAYQVAQTQPMKLAAMEALYQGGKAQSLSLVAGVSPFQQPDYLHQQGPPSLAEKMARGRHAIVALQQYRAGKQTPEVKQTLRDDMKYFGYGYVKSPDQVVPNIPINFWAFRIMVGLGMLFILYFLFAGHITWHKNIADDKWRWLCRAGIALVPLAYVATESGWIVAEMGRQPWTIQDLLPTWAAVSDLNSGSIIITFFLFLALFTTMLAVEINILFKQIKKGMEAPSV